MTTLTIAFAPRESAARDPLDRATEADIEISVGDCRLTELEDRQARTVRPTFRASAYRLAAWLAEHWWRLRWEPESATLDWQLSHNLAAVGGGYVWPALTIVSDGEGVTLGMRPSTPTPTEDIRYLVRRDLRIPVASLVSGIDHFVDAVIARLRAADLPDTELERLWTEIQQERYDPETATWRKLEALAGLDPGTEDGAFLEPLLTQQSAIGRSGLEELIADAKQATPETLKALADLREHSASKLALPEIAPLQWRIQADLQRTQTWNTLLEASPDQPWQRAYQAAGIAREYWGFTPGAISSARLAEVLGTAGRPLLTTTPPTTFPISAGFRDDASDSFAVVLGARAPTARRFALARLLGDYLVTSETERLLPATATRTARQKFQRAFAQQLLCPVEDLKAFLDTDQPNEDQIEEAAAQFDVSPLLIRSTLVNQGLLDRQVLQGT